MSEAFLSILACPACRGTLVLRDATLTCRQCDASFAHVQGVPAFVDAPPEGMTFTPKKDRKVGSSWRQANNAFYRTFAESVAPADLVLDVGAGHGYLREYFKAQYFATDVYPYRGVDFLCDLSERTPLCRHSLDVVLLNNVLEHLPDPARVLIATVEALKPGGRVAIAVPFLIKLHQTPYDFMRYTHFMLQRLLDNAGFSEPTIDAVYTPASLQAVFFREMFDRRDVRTLWKRQVTGAARSLAWNAIRAANRIAGSAPFSIERVEVSNDAMNPWVAGYHVIATKE